jgi:hypothetical protein
MTDNTRATPEPVEERWIFGGSRVSGQGKRMHAWLPVGDPVNDELYFRATGSYVPGSEYVVRVVRIDTTITRHGLPTYHGRHSDEAVRAELEARHRAAETRLRLGALERNDKRHTALDATLEPLITIIRKAPMADRDAILAYVLRRLSRGW